MEQHFFTGLVTLLIVATIWRSILEAVARPTPGGAILLTSTMYLVGATLVEWRQSNEAALLVQAVCAMLFSVYLLTYFGTSFALRLPRNVPYRRIAVGVVEPFTNRGKWLLLLTALGCVGVAVYLTGTAKLLAALYQFVVLGDTDTSVLEMRLEFESGGQRWLAPGYVKQLRDILLPFGALLVLFTIKRSAGRFLALAALLIPCITLLMISSGERGPVLLFVMGTVYTAFRAVRRAAISAKSVLTFAAFVVVTGGGAFYALTSSFTSRQYDDTSLAMVLVDRVVTRVPEENIDGYPVWHRGPPFPGAGWLSEVASVLPGTQQTLSNLIHEDLGGGDKGNSVLGLWVDVFYNFGWYFSFPIAMMLGIAAALFNAWVVRRRSYSYFHDVCGIWIAVTMLMVLSPFGFLLYGPFLLSAVMLCIGGGAKAAIGRSLSYSAPTPQRP